LSDQKPIWTDQDDVDVDYDELVSHDADAFLAEIKMLYRRRSNTPMHRVA
jgi:hypothetical protein